MLERFEQTKEFDARLVVDEQEQGSCQVRLNFNPYRTNDMEVEVRPKSWTGDPIKSEVGTQET